MSSFTVHIENVTSYTPQIVNITLTNCNWLYTQALANGQAISGPGNAQGTVAPIDPNKDYGGMLTVRYGYVGRGPDGGDVNINFGVSIIQGKPAGFVGATETNHDLAATWDLLREADDFIGKISIT
jgi:hypothetical protein